jgi:RHS repeat-associated protein
VDTAFAFTGRQFDQATGLQNNLNRWYDPSIGRWISEDPIGFEAGDANLYRYVGNSSTNSIDPSGLKPWWGIAKILKKKWTAETADRAGEQLAKELLEKLAPHRPDSQAAQEILDQLEKMGWVIEPLGKGSKIGIPFDEGGGIIVREMENGEKTGRFLEWYPGNGPHHRDPHWKFSSGETGILKTTGCIVGGIAIAAIPGAEEAIAGDIKGAARKLAYEGSPIGWGSWIADFFGGLFDSANDDLEDRKKTNPKIFP